MHYEKFGRLAICLAERAQLPCLRLYRDNARIIIVQAVRGGGISRIWASLCRTLMLPSVFQRRELDAICAGFASGLVTFEPLGYIPCRGYGATEQEPLLNSDACALAQERQERMSGVAQHRHATSGPSLQRLSVAQSPT